MVQILEFCCKWEVSKAGIFQDMRKKRHFETPIEKEKRKAIARHKQRRNQHSRFS
ncbi:30S ribosomal protein S21 [Nostoc sp.]|uniref:30S ribosomal protein S21 n=1 Tax=Nostoc sp. TaxID=1180 RepID=UPI002FF97C9E